MRMYGGKPVASNAMIDESLEQRTYERNGFKPATTSIHRRKDRQRKLRENAVAPMSGKRTLRRELECLKDDAFTARLCWLKIE